MEDSEETAGVSQFMNSALVNWLKSSQKSGKKEQDLDYLDLANGPFLEEVLTQIDSRTLISKTCPVIDVYSRVRNLDLIVRSLKSFYEEILGQLIVVRLPDPVTVGKDPISEKAIADLELLLLLVLGCAVQGPKKESVISDITRLPVDTQHSIVECIQQVTDNPQTIWSGEWSNPKDVEPEQKDALYTILVDHVKRLVKERDEYALVVKSWDSWHQATEISVSYLKAMERRWMMTYSSELFPIIPHLCSFDPTNDGHRPVENIHEVVSLACPCCLPRKDKKRHTGT